MLKQRDLHVKLSFFNLSVLPTLELLIYDHKKFFCVLITLLRFLIFLLNFFANLFPFCLSNPIIVAEVRKLEQQKGHKTQLVFRWPHPDIVA